MAEMESNSILYQTPSNETLRHRKEFYGLWKRCDDQTTTWLDRVQNQLDRCEFPSILSPEYLLIDRFVCELNDTERKFIQRVAIWTLERLKKHFKIRKVNNTDHRVNTNNSSNKSGGDRNSELPTTSSSPSLLVPVRCEPVDDGYSKNAARKKNANENSSLNEVKLEPITVVYEDLPTMDFSIDPVNGCTSAGREVPTVDVENEMPIDGMEFECEDYKFSIHDVTDAIATADSDEANKVKKFDIEDEDSNQSDRPLKKEETKQRKHKGKETSKQRNAKRRDGKRHACDQCAKTFSRSDHLKRHKDNIHQEIRPYICDICDRSFAYHCLIKNHMRIHVGLKEHSCDICKKTFTTKSGAMTHKMEVHDGIRSFACDQCSKKYARKTWLTLHKQFAHYGIKSYECKTCDKSFKDRNDLKQHFRVHGCENRMTEKLFACDKCNKSYTRTQYLEKHKQKVHERVHPYVCDICQRNFAQYFALKLHMVTHTGEKPFSCDQCDKVFTQSASLWQHKKSIHEGIRPFTCTECKKGFRSTYELRRHLVIHK